MPESSIGLLENRVFQITCMDQVMQILSLVVIVCITKDRFFVILVLISHVANHRCLTDSHDDNFALFCAVFGRCLQLSSTKCFFFFVDLCKVETTTKVCLEEIVLLSVLLPSVDLCQVSCNDHKGIVESNKADEDANVPMAIGEIVAVLQVLEIMH